MCAVMLSTVPDECMSKCSHFIATALLFRDRQVDRSNILIFFASGFLGPKNRCDFPDAVAGSESAEPSIHRCDVELTVDKAAPKLRQPLSFIRHGQTPY